MFKRYFRWALRERLVASRPDAASCSARARRLRVPKTLSEAQVEALLAAPDVDTPLGLRDRTMLELMYASGLRVSELVALKSVHLGLDEGALRVTGKGAQGAPGAVRRGGACAGCGATWPRRARRILEGQRQRRAVRHRARRAR